MKYRGRLLVCLQLLLYPFIVFSQVIYPVEKDGIFSFESNDFVFRVNSFAGGKVTSFAVSGQEVIYVDETEYLWGSTFWPSPQSEWRWPPSKQLDLGRYEGTIKDKTIELKSRKDSITGLVIKKIIAASEKDKTVTLTYRMINKSSQIKHNAPWEITRVSCGGLTFFPKGEGELWGKLAPYFQVTDGIVYYKYDKNHSGRRKFNSDGKEGWIAHITNERLLFIKQFEDIPLTDQAPGEAEVEIWLTPEHSHIELENQGRYVSLAVGDSLDYTSIWHLSELPENLKVEVGNIELITYVRTLLGIK